MKKKTIELVLIIVVIFLLVFLFLPIIKPIKVYGVLSGYTYTVYGEHVELESYNRKQEHVKIPNWLLGRKVKIIGGLCFSKNNQLQEILISDSIEVIKDFAFEKCINLKKVNLGKNVIQIDTGAFSNCDKLEEVKLNDKLEDIGVGCFSDCKKLIKIEIPQSVKIIDKQAFAFSGIEEIYIPNTIEYIGEGAFKDTKWQETQKNYVICGDNILIDYNGCEERVIIPQGIKFLSASFVDCKDVNEVYIPDSVTYIGDYTFPNSGSIKVFIPSSVTKMGTEYSIISDINNLTIVTTTGSYAEKYTKEQGIKCEIVDQIEYLAE